MGVAYSLEEIHSFTACKTLIQQKWSAYSPLIIPADWQTKGKKNALDLPALLGFPGGNQMEPISAMSNDKNEEQRSQSSVVRGSSL